MGRVCVNPSSTGNGSLHVVTQICRGARPSVTTLPNEAMSLKGKQLGTLSCVPAKFELLISGPVDDFLFHWISKDRFSSDVRVPFWDLLR